MKQRIFPLRDARVARVYVSQLLEQGLRFEVLPHPFHGGSDTSRVDVIVQEPVAPECFPNPNWVCQ